MDEFWEVLVGIFLAIVVAGGIFTSVFQISEASAHNDCHDKGKLIQVQVTYRMWDGCYVNQNGLWMPFDIWQYNRDHGIEMK